MSVFAGKWLVAIYLSHLSHLSHLAGVAWILGASLSDFYIEG